MKVLTSFFACTLILASISVHAANPDSLTIKHIQKVTNLTGGLGNVISDGDNFACRITSIGDLDSNGVPDLAVSASFDGTASYWGGAFYILFMNSDGTVKSSHKIYSGHSGMGTVPSGDRFGEAIANLGDIDGDGIQDLAVTAVAANDYTGSVYILNMKRNGDVRKSTLIDSSTAGFKGVINSGDILGFDAACPGDINGDGVNDLIIGAYGTNNNTGAAYVLFMNSNSTLKGYKKISDSALTLAYGDKFGESVGGIGDQDGDGVPDIAVGAPESNNGTGAFYQIHLNSDGSVKNYIKIDASQAALTGAISFGASFGTGISLLPDLDGDGNREILIGSETDNTGGYITGAAYILYMDGSHNVKAYRKIDNNTPGMGHGLLPDGEFGCGLTYLPSFNNNYNFTIAIGASGDSQSVYEGGAFYTIFIDSLNAGIGSASKTMKGTITTSTGAALKNQYVYLLVYNPADSLLSASDSVKTDTSGHYQFVTKDTSVYLLAAPDSTSYPDEMWTYYDSSLTIQLAALKNLGVGATVVNFNTLSGANHNGTGFIGGKITICNCKTMGKGQPVVGLRVILMDNNNKPLKSTFTNASGAFGFNNLGAGQYKIWVDHKGVDNSLAPVVSLATDGTVDKGILFQLYPTYLQMDVTTDIETAQQETAEMNIYPNPFVSSATLLYTFTNDCRVSVNLFDATGREISSLVNGSQTKGNYTFSINKSLLGLSAGIYFVKLNINNTVITQKLIVE